MKLSIYPLNRYLLNTSYVPDLVLQLRGKATGQTHCMLSRVLSNLGRKRGQTLKTPGEWGPLVIGKSLEQLSW